MDSSVADRTGVRPLLIASVAIFVASVAFRLGLLDSAIFFDEFYHILAAQGLLETGEPRIGTGTYDRVYGYTWFISKIFAFAENDIAAARISSIVIASLLIVVSFLWIRRHAGWTAAVIAAALAILSPIGIETANAIRFYVWQGFAFFLFATAVYAASVETLRMGRRIACWCAAAVLLVVSVYLQPLSAIGLAAVGLWWGVAVFLPWAWRREARISIIGGLLILGAIAFAAAFALGLVDAAWRELRFAPDWAAAVKDSEGYYHRFLLTNYATLWPAFPLAAIAGLFYRPRPALFCAMVFVVAFVFLSLAGMKSWRYIYFIMPFLFGVYAIGIAGVLAGIRRAVTSVAPGTASGVAAAAGVLLLVAAFLTNDAFPQSFAMARGEYEATEKGDWFGVAPVLVPMITDDMIIGTPRELQAFYHLGRADVTVSVSRLSELAEKTDFETDPRTGLPTVGTAEGAAHLIECTSHGIFIVPSGVATWIQPIFPEPETYDGPAKLTRVPEAAPFGFDVITWETPSVDFSACADVPAQLLPSPDAG
jgi:hypothetical protein